MLTAYLTATQQLLQNPGATSALYPLENLTTYINTARRQLAGEAKCIRVYGSLPIVANTRVYNFSTIQVTGISGVQTVLHVRQASVVIGAGQAYVRSRQFEWFQLYLLNQVVPPTGRPKVWAQYSEGVLGSLYVDPIPDDIYTLNLDTVCLPVDLVDDTTPEAIPSLWTDAVPYFAAYMALLSSQRSADAEKMFGYYETFTRRARDASTPDVLKGQYPQSQDPTLGNKLGIKPPRQGGG